MKFSVVIPLYNKEISITSTIESVLAQSHRDFELIIVNDGSTDCSLLVVKRIQDPRIKIIDKPNGGVSSARNCGIAEAQCEWIAFLDGDDLWQPDFLSTVEMMINDYEEASIIAVNYKNGYTNHSRTYTKEGYVDDYYYVARITPILWSSAVCIKKECFTEVGLFKEYLSLGEDLEMWSRLANKFKIAYSPRILAEYRITTENRACNSFNIQKSWLLHIDKDDYQSASWGQYYQAIVDMHVYPMLRHLQIANLTQTIRKHGVVILFRCIVTQIRIKLGVA